MFRHLSASAWGLMAILIAVSGMTGCGKAALEVEKALIQRGGKALAQGGEKTLERAASQGGKTAVKQESRFVRWAKPQEAGKAGREMGQRGREIRKVAEQGGGLLLNQPSGGEDNGQRFPHPVSSVRPLSGYEPRVDPVTGDFVVPNNYGGFILYDSSGNPLGFSARNKTTGELDCFDRFGNRR